MHPTADATATGDSDTEATPDTVAAGRDPSLEQLLGEAVSRHRQGDLPAAESLYNAVLAAFPDHSGALQGLTLICNQTGRFADAIGLAGRALSVAPPSAPAYNGLGYALQGLHRTEEAIASYEKAVALAPDFVEAHNNLGGALQSLGRFDEAVAAFERALAVQPMAEININLGAALAALNRHDEALAHYRTALALRPEFAEASNNLAVSLAALGRPAEAIPHYEQAMALRPQSAETRNNLGNALVALGRHEEAIARFGEALAIQPNYLEAVANTGHCLEALGRPAEAIAQFNKALDLNPRYAPAHFQIGRALAAQQRFPEAIVHFNIALREMPGNLEARVHLADALAVQNSLEEAAAHYREAIAAGADVASVHTNLGDVLLSLEQAEPAISSYERALTLDPGFVETHRGRAAAMIFLGRIDEARQAIEQAIALAPRQPELYRILTQVVQFAAGDPHLAAMETLAAELPSFAESDRIALHFALGKAYRDIGRHREAFGHLCDANALKRRQSTYDEGNALTTLRRTEAVFTPALFASKRSVGDPSDVPVFIVGMPRSGTTLVEQILASHPQVAAAGETPALVITIDAIADGRRFPEFAPDLTADQLRGIGVRYLAALRDKAGSAARITDKMMTPNFLMVGLIHLALPNAKIIHVRRDPVDTCLSCFGHLFPATLLFTCDLAELGRYYRGYARLMAHWRRVLPESAMLEVEYEALVGEFDPQARRILAHCGLEWDDACAQFHRTRRTVTTASAVQVRQPLYRDAVGRSQPYRDMLRPLLDALEGE